MKSDEGVIRAVSVTCAKWAIAALCGLMWFSADTAAAVCGGMKAGREKELSLSKFPKLEK